MVKEYEDKKKQKLKEKLHARLKVMRANRAPNNDDNVQYDAKGRKIGRMQQQCVNFNGTDVSNPFEIERLSKVLAQISANPELKKKFIEKSGLSEESCQEILRDAQKSGAISNTFDRVQEIL